MKIPPEVEQAFEAWLEIMRAEWNGEIPTKIHSRDIAPNGAPQWHPGFAQWIFADPLRENQLNHRKDDHRHRTTRAMRKLRKKCIREFDVMYLLVAKNMTYPQVAEALTKRAIRNEKPERYDVDAIKVLALSGLDKLAKTWIWTVVTFAGWETILTKLGGGGGSI